MSKRKPWLKGLFAHPGTYPVIARYANEPVFLQLVTAPGPRDMGLKIFDTPATETRMQSHDDGSDNETLHTQDFLFNNAPMLEMTDIDTSLDIIHRSANLRAQADRPRYAPMDMFTQSTFRFGEYYGHMGLFPAVPAMKSQDIATRTVTSNASPTILSDWLGEYFGAHDAVYNFQIQLATHPELHFTEDAVVVWDERSAPRQTMGSVTFPKQEGVMGPKRRMVWEEKVRLSPFTGLEAHRPLGGINRLRRHVYARSWRRRKELNACENWDVMSVDEIP